VLGIHKDPKQVQRLQRGRSRHRKRLGTEGELRPVLQKDAHTYGADDDRQEFAVTQGVVGDALEDDAEYAHEDDGNRVGQGKREIHVGHQPHGHKGRDHHEFALGEIDDGYRVVNENEPQSNEGIN